jgi:hypothetical protein
VLDSNPALVHALFNQAKYKYRFAADQKLTPGKQTITFDFAYDGGASIARGQGASITSTLVVVPTLANLGLFQSLNMLVCTEGKERTRSEYVVLLRSGVCPGRGAAY